ncbi:MAG TPA: universal stress protein [Gemmatimonadales bacterium]|nr:universal stress protein [Gemmatimonadales bacterium]
MARRITPFRSVLVPLDGSPLAEQAIPLALEIAQRARSKVKLVLVHQRPPVFLEPEYTRMYTKVDLAVLKSERRYLRGLVERLRPRMGKALTSAVLQGEPAPTLSKYVPDADVELVVMTTHGRGGLRRVWLGSVADQLVRTLEVPVLLARALEGGSGAEWAGIDKILVPLDGSPLAEASLEPARDLARLLGASISIVNVVSPAVFTSDPALPFAARYDEKVTAMRRDAAQDYLRDIVAGFQEQEVNASGIAVIGGSAADMILDLARSEQVGLVAIATHGRGGLKRLVLGSVADKLVRATEVPVLVYRPKGGQMRRSRRRT